MKNLKPLLILFLGTAILLNFAYFLDICDFNSPQALTAQLAPSDSGRSSTFDYWYVYFFILLALLAAYFVLSDYEPRGLPGFLIGLLVLVSLFFIYLLNRFFGLKIFSRLPSEEAAQPAETPLAPPKPTGEAGLPPGIQPSPPEILQPAETPPLAILPSFETPAAITPAAGPAASVPAGKLKKFFLSNKKPIFIVAVSVAVLILAAGGVFIFGGKLFVPPVAVPSPPPVAVFSPTPAPALTPTPTLTPTSVPTSVRTPTPTPTPTPVLTPTPVPSPALTPSPTQTIFPSPTPGLTPTPTFIAIASPTPAATPLLTPVLSPSPSPVTAVTPLPPTPGLPSFLRPGEQPYVAPRKTSLELFFEKLIPQQYRFTALIVIIFVLIPLLYFSPLIYLVKSGISHILFLIEKMRTTAGVSPPAPVYAKLTLTPLRIMSSIFVILLLAALIFMKPFSIFVSAPSPTATLPPILTPTPTPVLTPTPTAALVITPTPAASPSPAITPTATPVIIISPTPLAAPSPSPATTLSPSPTPALTPTPTAVAIFSPTPLPTPAVTPTPSPVATITPIASPTPSPLAVATESPFVSPTGGPVIETPPPSIFVPVKELYRRAVSAEYRWLIYLLAAVWFAVLALLPVLWRLARVRGKLGNLFKKIVAGKIGIMDFRFSVIAGNWVAAEWRTKTLSDSVVEFSVYPSSSPKYQQELAIDSELTKEHKIIIRGLKPDTTYYFKVSSTDKFGNREQTPEMTFKTAEPEKKEKAQIII